MSLRFLEDETLQWENLDLSGWRDRKASVRRFFASNSCRRVFEFFVVECSEEKRSNFGTGALLKSPKMMRSFGELSREWIFE